MSNNKFDAILDNYTDTGTYDFDVFRFAIAANEFAEVVSKCAHEHGWWEGGERNMGEMIALMHSELSEGLEAWRDGEPMLWYDYGQNNGKPCGIPEIDTAPVVPAALVDVGDVGEGATVRGKPCGLASEFADTIIRILNTCETLGIPITSALVHKHAYNRTRPYRHGGKLA
ncbi:MazG-like nucleotide pyrophosphohydrolase [Mycobacterium phage Leopard]|nr:MazG-like nucleotide pyrophosphohydrolase [Mycobacterium phage Leopard]